MKVTKIRDLLLLKRVDFGPKMIRGIYKFDDFWSKSKYCTQWKWPKIDDFDPPEKFWNFTNFMNLSQIAWKMNKIYDIWKKPCFFKKLKIDGFWPKFIDYNSWNSKIQWQK